MATEAKPEGLEGSRGAENTMAPLPSKETFHIEGRVLTALGVACEAAQVTLVPEGTALGERDLRTETNSVGVFRFDPIPAGNYIVAAVKLEEGTALQNTSTDLSESVQLTLSGERRSLAGLVRDSQTQAALSGTVVLDTGGYRSVTDEMGRFSLPMGKADVEVISVIVRHDGYLATGAALSVADSEPIIDLHPTSFAGLRVIGLEPGVLPTAQFSQRRQMMLDNIVDATVRPLQNASFLLAADGMTPSISIPIVQGIEPTLGTYCFISAPGCRSIRTTAFEWDPADTMGGSVPAIRLPKGRDLQLTVVDSSTDEPLTGAWASRRMLLPYDPLDPSQEALPCHVEGHTRDAGRADPEQPRTDAEGRITLRGMMAEATCISVAMEGSYTRHILLPTGQTSIRIALDPIPRASTHLFGQVTTASGAPAPSCNVTARDPMGGVLRTVTDKEGRFDFPAPFDLPYRIYYQSHDGVSGKLDGSVHPSSSPINLTLN
ncbi:MAG: carboxypeptidase regulatory-like domain-containing protein [bacterium]|nr:carboxypeptidase regulatory-like domain-containing protein [bacterium]